MTAPYVVGDSSPFLKRVLIPFWVVRIFIMLISIVVYGLLLAGLAILENDRTTRQKLEKEYNTSLNLSVLIALAVISLLITLACLILDIVCIVKRAKRTLSPRFFLIVNVIQSLIFTLSFIFSFIGARTSAVGVVISVLIWLSFIGLLIYASVIFHKFRKGSLRGEYKPAHNPESAAFVQTVSTDYNQEYPKPPAAYADGQQYGAPQPYGAPQSYGAPQPYGGAPQTGYTGYNPQQPQSYEMGNR